MSGKYFGKKSSVHKPANSKSRSVGQSLTDWDYLDSVTDEEIEEAVRSDPDAMLLDDDFWKNAKLVMPKSKKAISFRVDQEVLDWFKQQGRGYQTRMNAVLYAFVKAQERIAGKKS